MIFNFYRVQHITLLCFIALSVQAAYAQNQASGFLYGAEREKIIRERQEIKPDIQLQATISEEINEEGIELNPKKLVNEEINCIKVSHIELIGDSAEQFQWVLDAANKLVDGTLDAPLNRCLGVQSINVLMHRMQNALIRKGFTLAQIVIGEQKHLIDDGKLVFTLFPGKIRRIKFTKNTHQRATKWNALPMTEGEIFNLREAEQSLENFKRLPTVEANILLYAASGEGSEPGQSDLIIEWQQKFPLRFSLSIDDAGSKTTGRYQGSVTVAYDHPFTLNDLFYISFNHNLESKQQYGTKAYVLHYSIPYQYWLLGLTQSQQNYYQTIAGINQSYIYSGRSQNTEIELSRMLYRDLLRKTTLSLSAWTKNSQNYIEDTELTSQRRRMAGWELGLAHREFIQAAQFNFDLKYRQGTGAGSSLAAPEEKFGEGSARPKVMTSNVQFNLPFRMANQQLNYNLSWRAQWNHTPLIVQDRFALGGRYTVRGFDGENQLIAERGWLIRNDLAWQLRQSQQQFYLGIDYGQVRGQSSLQLIGKHLAGAAFGLKGSWRGLSYDLFAGAPLSKPSGFKTANTVLGFSMNQSF